MKLLPFVGLRALTGILVGGNDEVRASALGATPDEVGVVTRSRRIFVVELRRSSLGMEFPAVPRPLDPDRSDL